MELKKILDSWQPGHGLPGAVYRDPEIYESEIRRIFLKSWQYVGHASQIPQRGDYFLFEIAGESVILVRDGEGAVNALLNACRSAAPPALRAHRRCGSRDACRHSEVR